MNRKLNVLILGIGGNVSQGIMTALKVSKIPCRIIGACVSSESLGLYFCDAAYISPYAKDISFVPWVVGICKKENIDIIFSGVEENIEAMEKHRDLLNQVKSIFISASLEFLKIGNNKLKTCQWLKENGCNYPKFAEASNMDNINALVAEVGFPLLAKPIIGKGSTGVMVVRNKEELLEVPSENYVLQEYLGDSDNEYTVGCYRKKSGELDNIIICKRHLRYGTTFKAEIVHDDIIEKECINIASKFGSIGPLNIQLRMHHGKPVCFELNVRFSGTTPLRARWGYNDVAGMINEYLLDKDTNLDPVQKGVAYRYFNEAYISIDMQAELKRTGYVVDCDIYHNYKEV